MKSIVLNPPYFIKWVDDDNVTLINDLRFVPAGVLTPKSKVDMAFIMHHLSWLASNGTVAIAGFPESMYHSGDKKEQV